MVKCPPPAPLSENNYRWTTRIIRLYQRNKSTGDSLPIYSHSFNDARAHNQGNWHRVNRWGATSDATAPRQSFIPTNLLSWQHVPFDEIDNILAQGKCCGCGEFKILSWLLKRSRNQTCWFPVFRVMKYMVLQDKGYECSWFNFNLQSKTSLLTFET